MENNNLQIQLVSREDYAKEAGYDLDRIIYDLDSQMELLSSKADQLDYLVSIASGILCGMLDILWTGEFDLARGREISSEAVDQYVVKTAKMLGCKTDDLQSAVRFLEGKFPIPSDGNTPDFGGGLQHHLRDFAHHPTIVGLVFSLLTQFTGKAYGTDENGRFLIVDVPEAGRALIGSDPATKILQGTIIWFFHLVSDMAGSSSTAGLSGGTGIPGPLLSLAKELSAMPFFRNLKVGDNTLSVFLSKLFNGTLFARRDASGKIEKDTVLKFDLRGELGVAEELGRQAIPVIANECMVRIFYFVRHLAVEMRGQDIASLDEMERIDWDAVKPKDSPTMVRMLTIATGIFTALDVAEAVITQSYLVSVNYVGVGRFAVALGEETLLVLKKRNVRKIRQMYEDIDRAVFREKDNRIYERIGADMNVDMEKFGLTEEQTEILYNLEYYKTANDIEQTRLPVGTDKTKALKREWLREWQDYMTNGFSSFVQMEGAELHWYTKEELLGRVAAMEPERTWFRLVLLEAMLFEPYFPLGLEENKKGEEVPSKKYRELNTPIGGYKKDEGDRYLDAFFTGPFYEAGYIKRLRKCYDKVLRELNEVLKTALTAVAVTAGVMVVAIATAGAFAPSIAVALVGSNFTGLSGAALTSACLAYLGGGAVAAGGLGMAGGTIAIVGGGAVLGLGVGAGVGGSIGAAQLLDKKATVLQSAKLLVSVREIFLNDEHDIAYSNSVYEQYVDNIAKIEKDLVDLELREAVASDEEKKKLKAEIKNTKDSVEAMKIAMKSMNKFISSFGAGKTVADS